MSNLPAKTGAPLLVDNDVANTVDFHVAATDFLKVVQIYLNEVATGYAHNYSLATDDPITQEANFFKDLNNGTLDLTTKASGKNENVKTTLTEKIDAQLGATETWVTDNSGVVQSRLNKGIIEYLAINNVTQATRFVPVEQDVLSQVNATVDQLSRAYSADQMSEEFVLYWIEKFRTAHQSVKDAYRQLVTDPTQDYFTDFSDSMGSITRISENVDSTLIPFSDPTMDLSNLIPSPYNAVLDDKLDDNVKFTIIQMSKLNNVLYRSNVVKLLNVVTTSNWSHGENLVTDDAHYRRVKQLADELNGNVADVLGKVARIMYYIRTIPSVNSQSVTNFAYTTDVEDTLLQIDILKNKVQKLQSTRSLQSLSAQIV